MRGITPTRLTSRHNSTIIWTPRSVSGGRDAWAGGDVGRATRGGAAMVGYRLLLPFITAATLLSACQSQLLFRNDHRVQMVAPANFDTVRQPLDIRWLARAFDAP